MRSKPVDEAALLLLKPVAVDWFDNLVHDRYYGKTGCNSTKIIGYREAYPIVIKGLKRLEYRGYDSAGIAVLQNDKLEVFKAVGKIKNPVSYTHLTLPTICSV